jgi:ATP-binding cassette subfamily C protein LapB
MTSLMVELKRHCTLVMVSHRPSLIAMANKQYRLIDKHLVPVLRRTNKTQNATKDTGRQASTGTGPR